jgi:hypothetical protein
MTGRRFPPPWTVEEYRGIAYIVRDANNFAVAYVYFESDSSHGCSNCVVQPSSDDTTIPQEPRDGGKVADGGCGSC